MAAHYAAIFDMDGVLVDSYEAHYQSWSQMAQRNELPLTREQFEWSFGRTSRETIAALWGDDDLSEERIAALDQEKEERYRDIIRADFPAMEGVGELLKSLADAGFSMAIGSSGPAANVAATVEFLPHGELLNARVTGDDVTRGKPDPQVFLLAAEKLGVPPNRCAVVEDAPAGIAAAHAAGMVAIGLASTGRTAEELADAELVVQHLNELTPERIAGLINR
jgi:beta-phosphoglucomutase